MRTEITSGLNLGEKSQITGIIFSKDRALQLEATLKSFFRHCRDAENAAINILHTSSKALFANQYETLAQEHQGCKFIEETNFKKDLLNLLQKRKFILFLVDDNIFTHDFSLADCVHQLRENRSLLAFSLRLGRNTTKNYIRNRQQTLPEVTETSPDIHSFNWTESDGDFAFPLEVSSSIYRACDLLPIIDRLDFRDPNTFEFNLSHHKYVFAKLAPKLACFKYSVTFCNPINIVNTSHRCRAGNRLEYSSSELAATFNRGLHIDIKKFDNYLPESCHQEVEFEFEQFNLKTDRLQSSTTNLLDPGKSDFDKAVELKQTFLEMGMNKESAQVFQNHLRTHPENEELVSAIERWEINSPPTPAAKVSVIIPAHNCAETINKSLESIDLAFEFCKKFIKSTQSEIVVVNDNSSDATSAVLEKCSRTRPHLKIINNRINLGAGPSRNSGVKHSTGDFIFFLDGDDLFFKEHIFLCLDLLLNNPTLHFVQTGIRIDEEILPYWRNAIENSVPFNLCVRRWCHDMLGGYPEGEAFMHGQDVFYRLLLTRYCLGYKLKRKTVHHFRYPGNALDRQIKKFSQPPNQKTQDETLTEKEKKALPKMQQAMAEKDLQLRKLFCTWTTHLKQLKR
jgi:hypothetical protein